MRTRVCFKYYMNDSWYATKLGMYLPQQEKFNFQILFYYD